MAVKTKITDPDRSLSFLDSCGLINTVFHDQSQFQSVPRALVFTVFKSAVVLFCFAYDCSFSSSTSSILLG